MIMVMMAVTTVTKAVNIGIDKNDDLDDDSDEERGTDGSDMMVVATMLIRGMLQLTTVSC